MIHPKIARLRKVRPGEPLRAEDYNALVDALQISFTGPNVQVTGVGFLFREPPIPTPMKWVIVRPPIVDSGLSFWAEDAVRHPNYGDEGPHKGRWIGVSEQVEPPQVSTVAEYPVWPHRLTDHYQQYVWDGQTRIRETQILLAYFVDDVWYIHPDPPFIARRYPHTTVKTPCSPQEATP